MLLSTAIVVGFLGSVHCLGMCAPITWAVPGNTKGKWKWLLDRIVYNLGRVITYSLLGVGAGLIGSTFSIAGWQQGLSIGAGILLLVGVMLFGMEIPDKSLSRPLIKIVSWTKSRIGSLLAKKGWKARLSLGLLNGLLPCGLVYAALIAAASMGSIHGGALYMALFGLGTFPMMLAAAFLGKTFGSGFRQGAWRLAPKLVALVGILFILRGLNLGIPYLSPALSDKDNITECIGNGLDNEIVTITEDAQ